jgi:hypothetical protein
MLDIALAASGCDSAKVVHQPRLHSDNGSSYIAGDLAECLDDKGMKPVRGAQMHPQTEGAIERWHQTPKNRILRENYFFELELEAAIIAFIDHYNNHHYYESMSTSPQPTSTSGAAKPSWPKGGGICRRNHLRHCILRFMGSPKTRHGPTCKLEHQLGHSIRHIRPSRS